MTRCEDFPCCGHTDATGDVFCPDEEGLVPCCECGRRFKIRGSSICPTCLDRFAFEGWPGEESDYPEDIDEW